MKTIHLAVFVCATILLSGCGVTLEAKRVTLNQPTNAASVGSEEIPNAVPGTGISYALPKTEFEIVQPVKVKVPTGGPLRDIFDSCSRACDATSGVGNDEACKFTGEPQVVFAPPELRTVSVPDYSHVYQIQANADLFQSLNFKFDIASNGVLDKADTQASNMAYELASSIATTAIKAIGAASMPMAANLQRLRTSKTSARNCYETSIDVGNLPKSGTLQCGLLGEIKACLAPFDSAVEQERSGLNALFDKAATAKMDSNLLTALAANRRERVNEASAKRAEAASLYGLSEGKTKEASYQIILPMGGPAEFRDYETSAGIGKAITGGQARILGTSDNAPELLSTLTSKLKDSPRTYKLKTTMPTSVKVTAGDESAALGKGYRYRIPMASQVAVTVYADDTQQQVSFGPLTESKTVAQYGPVAALPSTFKGKSGRVMVKHWPDSGGLQTVEIGAEAVPTTAVTGVIDEAFNQFKARKEKAEAAAAAAAAVDPELDSLTRQQEILALKKQIKDLEDALKN